MNKWDNLDKIYFYHKTLNDIKFSTNSKCICALHNRARRNYLTRWFLYSSKDILIIKGQKMIIMVKIQFHLKHFFLILLFHVFFSLILSQLLFLLLSQLLFSLLIQLLSQLLFSFFVLFQILFSFFILLFQLLFSFFILLFQFFQFLFI